MHKYFSVSVFIQLCVIENSVAFVPKYRRKIFCGGHKAETEKIQRELCDWKGIHIVEAEVCPDHVHMLV